MDTNEFIKQLDEIMKSYEDGLLSGEDAMLRALDLRLGLKDPPYEAEADKFDPSHIRGESWSRE